MFRILSLLTLSSLLLTASVGCSSPEKNTEKTGVEAAGDEGSILARGDRTAVRALFGARRDAQVARLESYSRAGQFPHNDTRAQPLHLFRDAAGRYCAVANLVHRDGRDDLVADTVRTNNALAVVDVHDGPMMNWMLSSGLTQEELVEIQVPAPPMQQARPEFRQRVDEFVAQRKLVPQPRVVIHQDQDEWDAPPPVQPVYAEAFAAPPGVDEAGLQVHIRTHLADVERNLLARREESLDLATTRYLAARDHTQALALH